MSGTSNVAPAQRLTAVVFASRDAAPSVHRVGQHALPEQSERVPTSGPGRIPVYWTFLSYSGGRHHPLRVVQTSALPRVVVGLLSGRPFLPDLRVPTELVHGRPLFPVGLRRLAGSSYVCRHLRRGDRLGCVSIPAENPGHPFAAFSIILLATEAHSFLTHYEPHPPQSTTSQLPRWETREDLPNIYHLILDGYQADFFPQTLSSEYRAVLDGFVNYRNNVALYPVTNMSLPSIFSGKRRPEDLSSLEYMRRAFNTDASFLYWLKRAGYKTLAYGPKVYEFDLELFDHMTFHQHNPGAEALVEMNTATFKRLWFWANSPRLFTRLLLSTEWFFQFGEDDLKLVKNRNFLPFSVPITSYLSFENYLDQEALLPARGRYTLIHLVIPHSPEVLSSDCSYDSGGRATSQLEQSGCATKLLVKFVERLRELNRLDDSLVIAHADHGAYDANSKAGTHSADSVSLGALLLIKPIGGQGEMATSEAKSTLVDLAPTLLKAVGVEHELNGEGSFLVEALPTAPVARLD